MSDLKYPIGQFSYDGVVSPEVRLGRIEQIAAAPAALRQAVAGLSAAQLDTPHREGGRTVRQVGHHLPDSHVNAYVRVKLALTEDAPLVKPYEQARWAELDDTRSVPVEVSLTLLEALHVRWVAVWRAMAPAVWRRGFRHPEYDRLVTLDEVLAMYAWHGRHHVAQITGLRERQGWR